MTISNIQTRDLAALAANQTIDLIDVRTAGEFETVHAQNAKNFPLDSLSPADVVRQRVGSADQPIYVICKSGGRSMKACEQFVGQGIDNVVNVTGGTDAWVANGLPVNQSDRNVMSLDRQVRIAAGSLVVVGTALGAFVHPAWIGLATFVGAGLVFAGLTDTCGMATILAKMPWNQPKRVGAPVCDTGG